MDSPRPDRDHPKRRRRHKARKVRLDVLRTIMEQQEWNEQDLVGHTGLSPQTIRRILDGGYIRRDTAQQLREALADYTMAPLLEEPSDRPGVPPPDPGLPASLEALYQACERLPLALRQQVRTREFAALIAERTHEFVGRQWLFDALDQFLSQHRCGYFLVRGKPGVGKTAFAAALTQRRGCPHHFNCRFTRLNRAEQFLTGVCGQLIAAYGLPYTLLPSRTTQDSGILADLLAEAVRTRPGGKLLLVVDALDEVEQRPKELGNSLALPPALPDGTYVVLTLRDVDCELRFDCPFHTLHLEQQSDGNLRDVRHFLQRQASKAGIRAYCTRQGLEKDGFVTLLEGKSQGNFMYLRYVLPEIERGRFAAGEATALPEGLANYYESHWALLRDHDRSAWFGYKLPVLLMLATAKEPVSLRLLADSLPKVPPAMIRDVLRRDWRQFLEREVLRLGEVSVTGWKLYHASFADFLRTKASDPEEGVDLDRASDAWFAYGQQHGITPD